jgi:hypothetical protein
MHGTYCISIDTIRKQKITNLGLVSMTVTSESHTPAGIAFRFQLAIGFGFYLNAALMRKLQAQCVGVTQYLMNSSYRCEKIARHDLECQG